QAADVKREDMAGASFDAALNKFHELHTPGSQYEHLVDLATALEAILTGSESESEAVTFRLRSRAAALLPTENDSATSIFRDVGALYSLRSKLVHGGAMKQTELRKEVGRISTVPPGTI